MGGAAFTSVHLGWRLQGGIATQVFVQLKSCAMCIPLGYKTYDGMMTTSPLGRGNLGHHTRHQRVSSDSDWPGWHFAKWVEQCGTSSFHWYCFGCCCAQGTRFTIRGCRLPHTALGGQVGGYSFGQAGRANQGKPGHPSKYVNCLTALVGQCWAKWAGQCWTSCFHLYSLLQAGRPRS